MMGLPTYPMSNVSKVNVDVSDCITLSVSAVHSSVSFQKSSKSMDLQIENHVDDIGVHTVKDTFCCVIAGRILAHQTLQLNMHLCIQNCVTYLFSVKNIICQDL